MHIDPIIAIGKQLYYDSYYPYKKWLLVLADQTADYKNDELEEVRK